MITVLKENERLVLLDNMPRDGASCFVIADASTADPAKVVPLGEGECLVLAGTITTADQMQAARERYENLLAAGTPAHIQPGRSEAVPFYQIIPISDINKKTGLTDEEMKACRELVSDVAERHQKEKEATHNLKL